MINYVPLYLDELIFVFGENSEVVKMPSDYPTPPPAPNNCNKQSNKPIIFSDVDRNLLKFSVCVFMLLSL